MYARKGTYRGTRMPQIVMALMVIALIGTAIVTNPVAAATPRKKTTTAEVTQAKQIVAAAKRGFVSAASLTAPVTALTSFNVVTTKSPKIGKIKMIGVASCVNPCEYVGSLVGTIGDQFGDTYTGTVGSTPENWQELTEEAINQKPNVIVFNGVSDAAVTAQVAQAKAKGIKVVGISVTQTVSKAAGYTAYVSVRQDVTYRLMVDEAIATSNGTAQMAIVEPSGYPSTDTYVANAVTQGEADCPGCSFFVQKEDTGSLVDPTEMDSIVTALLSAHPKLNYILFGDDFYALSAAQLAAQRLHRTVHLIAQDGSTTGLDAVKSGIIMADAGCALQWIAYAGYDEILRVVAGEAPIAANAWGGGAHLWTPTDLPSTIDNAAMSNILSRFVNYKAAYAKLWGQS
jgi:ABC-type sugar transport system substrate-binding protein